MVRWKRLQAESMSCATSSGPRISGSLRGRLGLGIRPGDIFEQITTLQRLDIEEAERGHMLLDSARVQLFLLKQVGLILAQVLRTEPVGWLVKMVGEFLDDS